jgi:hypothetical protein
MSKTWQASTLVAEPPPGRELYERDEHEWIAAQVSALADGEFNRLDRANLVEYLTEMTVRDRRELQSRLVVLLHHLLRVQVQPERLTRSWVTTILEQQSEIRSIIDSIPSLGRQPEVLAAAAYSDAAAGRTRIRAAGGTLPCRVAVDGGGGPRVRSTGTACQGQTPSLASVL